MTIIMTAFLVRWAEKTVLRVNETNMKARALAQSSSTTNSTAPAKPCQNATATWRSWTLCTRCSTLASFPRSRPRYPSRCRWTQWIARSRSLHQLPTNSSSASAPTNITGGSMLRPLSGTGKLRTWMPSSVPSKTWNKPNCRLQIYSKNSNSDAYKKSKSGNMLTANGSSRRRQTYHSMQPCNTNLDKKLCRRSNPHARSRAFKHQSRARNRQRRTKSCRWAALRTCAWKWRTSTIAKGRLRWSHSTTRRRWCTTQTTYLHRRWLMPSSGNRSSSSPRSGRWQTCSGTSISIPSDHR